jgi:hypothetical protein
MVSSNTTQLSPSAWPIWYDSHFPSIGVLAEAARSASVSFCRRSAETAA